MRLLCALLLGFALSCSALAAPLPALTVEERAWLAKNGNNLVLSFDRSFPPIEFEDLDGSFTGLSSDIVRHIEESLGITFRKEGKPWGDILQGLQDGSTAIAPAITPTQKRRTSTIFTPAYVRLPLVIITSRDVEHPLSLNNLDGMRVAVVRGYASGEAVRNWNLGRYTLLEVDSIPEGLRMVSFGNADAFVENLGVTSWYIRKQALTNLRVAGDLGTEQELCIGISRQYPLLATAVSKALAALPEADRQRFTDHWIPVPSALADPGLRKTMILIAVSVLSALTLLAVLIWMLRTKLRRKVSELEAAQAALTDQVGRFRLAMEATQAGYWEFFPAEQREEHSPEWSSMLGYPSQHTSGTMDTWSDLIHPADRASAVDAFTGYINEGGKGMYEAEYRMRDKDGSWRWILAKGRTVVWDGHGRPRRVIGLNIDVHKSREAQDAAQRIENLNRALLEQTSQFIGLLDPRGTLQTCNRSSLDWAGARAEDVFGRPFWEGPWWPDRDNAEAMLRATIERVLAGETVRREIEPISPEGEPVVFDFMASPFRDESGDVVSIIVEARDISDIKKKQRAVEESERRFRTIFENAPYSMAIKRLSDGRYMDANAAFLKTHNIAREMLPDVSEKDIGSIPDEDRKVILDSLNRHDHILNQETRVRMPNGSMRHILFSGGPITLDGEACILSMAVDITELKEAQDALRRSEEMFSRLFQLSPDMITLAREEDGTLLEANEAFSRFTGYTREEALGKTTVELGIFAPPERRSEFAAAVLRNGRVENFEFDIRHRSGSILHASASARLMTIDDRNCILTITRDVSQMRVMQETMVQSEKMLSLGGIAAGIAHEINNPLGIVLQAVQTIALRTRPDFPRNIETAKKIGVDLEQVDRYLRERKVDTFIRDIQGAAVRAAEIIRHMLDFSRRSESRRSVCSIASIIDNALRLASSDYDLKKNYDFKSIEIIRDIPEDLPHVACTETEIEQVLLNLLRNAAQAMTGGDTPTQEPRITVSARALGGKLVIEISDNGPGIPEQYIKRIFEPFFTTKSSGAGTGLGLSVSYFIVTKGHGGQMRVACPPGGGTVFIVELPGVTDAG
jgi:PAS domain S-box-containing protein